MIDIDQQLRQAGEETRRFAATRPVAPAPRSRSAQPHRGWLAFAASFAVVIALFGVLPWAMQNTQTTQPAVAGDDTTLSAPETTSPTVIASTAAGGCSAEGVEVPQPVGDIPDEIAAKRDAIVAAVSSCDLARIEELASADFRTSVVGGGIEDLARWEESGEGRLDVLLNLFGTTPGVLEIEDGLVYYVWPAAAIYEWDDVPHDLVDELEPVINTGDLDAFANFGSYLGWKTAIDSNGNWVYFVAGD